MQTNNFVLFETELFLWDQRDEDLNHWFPGGDCAGWFYMRLLATEGICQFLEPVMEDWGWTFAVAVEDVRVCVNVWVYFEMENSWVFGIEPWKRFFRRQSPAALQRAKDVAAAAVDQIMEHDPRFLRRKWFEENPFDLGIKFF
jgi:hypothetical protein